MSDLSDAVVTERVERFWSYCKFLLSTHPDAVWVNFDETPLWLCQRAGRTNVPRERVRTRQPVRLKGDGSLSRKRITVGLAISTNAAFAAELPVFAVFKGSETGGDRRPDSAQWAGVEIPDGVVVHWQPKAWMNEEILADWVGHLIQARDRVFGPGRPVVLVWDSFRGHLTEALRILCNDNDVHMVVIPGGLTALLQGLDTHVNRAFKAACRAWWRRYVSAAADAAAAALTHQDLLEMIADAARNALAGVLTSGPLSGELSACASFLHNGLTNAVDGSQDHLINIRHPAVFPERRSGLPCALPEPSAVAVGAGGDIVAAEPDPGYESGPSSAETSGAEDDSVDEAARFRQIIVERDAWLDSLLSEVADSAGSPPRGFVGAPGARRSTRRVKPALPKQERCAGGATGSGSARGSRG